LRKTETGHFGQLGKWRVIGESVAGSSHEKRGIPCQDFHDWAILVEDILIISVADGAGSAAKAEVGSCIAAQTAIDHIIKQNNLPASTDDDTVWTEFLKKTFNTSREALRIHANLHSLRLSDLATTLILSIVTPELCAVAQLGDGIAVARDNEGTLFALTIPQRGEYINEANFLTSSNALKDTEVFLHRKLLTHIAVISDGLQRIGLRMPGCEPFPGFFSPIFSFISNIDSDKGSEDKEELLAFLNSAKIKDRADDDLTLVVGAMG
jgi:hypothetical protein